MKLENARILITGGSKGLGKAMASLLVASGAKVAITGRHEETLQAAAEATGALPILADVAQPEDVEKTFAKLRQDWDGLDCLINNAGIGGSFATLEEVSLEEMQQVYNTNVFGMVSMTQHATKMFKAQNYGNIINIASTAGLKGFARGTVYASSKFAVRCMTQCWQAELRPHNIRVILINPSEVPTAFGTTDGKEKAEEAKKLSPNEIAHTVKATLEMDDRGFIPEVSVFATNPW